MTVAGQVVEVRVEARGSQARDAALLGATSLTVVDPTPFDVGAQVLIDDDVYTIASVVEVDDADDPGSTNGTLTLTPGLIAAVDASTPVLLWSGEQVLDDVVLTVSVSPNDPPVDVRLTYDQRKDWTVLEGALEPPVAVLLSADMSQLLDAPGYRPYIDGAYIDPMTLPSTRTTYSDVNPSDTDGYKEGDAWWVMAGGKVVSFWAFTGGVWAQREIVTAEALVAQNAFIDALTATDFSAVTITGATIQTEATPNQGLKFGNVDGAVGMFAYTPSGDIFFKAVSAEAMAVVAGEVKARSLTVSSPDPLVTAGSSFGGITEIASGGALRLTAGTTAPKSAPTVTTGYDSVQFTNDGMWAQRHGLAFDGTDYYTARMEVGVDVYVERWSSAGALLESNGIGVVPTTSSVLGGIVAAPSNLFVLTGHLDLSLVIEWTADRISYTTYNRETAHRWSQADGARRPAFGYDAAANQLLIAQSRATNGNKIRVHRYATPAGGGGAALVLASSIDTTFGATAGLSTVLYDATFDLGAPRYVLSDDAGTAFVPIKAPTSGVEWPDATGEQWPMGATDKVGAVYTGGVFKSMDTTGLLRTYTGITSTTTSDMTKWVSNTLAQGSTPTYQTDQSPRSSIVMPKRSKLIVTTSAIVGDGSGNTPDRVRVYVGKGTTDPGVAGMWLPSSPGAGIITQSYSTLATTGTNPPASNNFPGGTGSAIEGPDGVHWVEDDGSIPATTPFAEAILALGEHAKAFSTASASPTGTTNVTVSGLSLGITSPGTSAVYEVTISADVLISTAGAANIIELLLDGAVVNNSAGAADQIITAFPAANSRVRANNTYRVTGLSAGAHAFTVRTRNAVAATNASLTSGQCSLTVERKK